jgi:8-oxo-dGTP pyrophosphatase MutT (NUDIX family)
MAREPIPIWCFAVVVVQRGDQFLIVHERKHGQLWYFPAGRVEPGETFAEAAYRETLEETGIPIRVVGILRVEYSPRPTTARLRVVFLAEPIDNTPPKSVPDEDSLGAAWVSLKQLTEYPLRGAEVQDLVTYVASGATVYPENVIQSEGMPYWVEE